MGDLDPRKRENLEEAGWMFGDAEDFLGLSEEESRLVDLRLAVCRAVRKVRLDRKLTKAQAAAVLKISPSQMANIEAAAGGATLDLMFRSLFALGGTMGDFFHYVRPEIVPKITVADPRLIHKPTG